MSKFMEIFQDLVVKTLKDAYQFTVQFAPKIVLALIILLLGWIFAFLLRKIFSKILKGLGVDILAKKIGLKNFLEKGGIQRNLSSIVGLFFYWLIIFSALIMTFNTLELEAASQLINRAILYIPKVVVSLVILALGIFLSQFFGKFVQKSAHLANIPLHSLLGKAARYVIISLAVMIGLEYLGLLSAIVIEYAVIIFGIAPLIFCLIFLIAGKDIVSSILAGRFLLKEYKKGDAIEFDGIKAEVQSVDLITTRIKEDGQEIIIPNSELAKKTIKKIKSENV